MNIIHLLRPGLLVTFNDGFRKELGVVKSVSEDGKSASVVFKFSNDLLNYDNYTGARCSVDQIKVGWDSGVPTSIISRSILDTYDYLCVIPGRNLCGIAKVGKEIAVYHGITIEGPSGYWTFDSELEAFAGLRQYTGKHNPVVLWKAYKGHSKSYRNPLRK